MIGQRIKELRKAAGLTQQELSGGVVTRSYISQIEKGTIQPSHDTLVKLAAKLNVPVEEFFKAPENDELKAAEQKRAIKFVESLILSYEMEKAIHKAESTMFDAELLNDYDLGLLNWCKAKILIHRGEDGAVEALTKSIEHFEQLRWCPELLRCHITMAEAFEQAVQIDDAFNWIMQAHQMAVENLIAGAPKAELLDVLARTLRTVGDEKSADYYESQADMIFARIGGRRPALSKATLDEMYTDFDSDTGERMVS